MNATYKLLVDGCIRYVGSTKCAPSERLRSHLAEARGNKKSYRLNWLRSLTQPPILEVIEWAPPGDWQISEQYWISLAREYGCRLVNGTDGGEGLINPTAETREKMRLSHVGRKLSEETREKMRGPRRYSENREKAVAARRGKPLSSAHRAAIGAANRGWISPATIAGSVAAKLGKPFTAEHRAKMATAQTARRLREKGANG